MDSPEAQKRRKKLRNMTKLPLPSANPCCPWGVKKSCFIHFILSFFPFIPCFFHFILSFYKHICFFKCLDQGKQRKHVSIFLKIHLNYGNKVWNTALLSPQGPLKESPRETGVACLPEIGDWNWGNEQADIRQTQVGGKRIERIVTWSQLPWTCFMCWKTSDNR